MDLERLRDEWRVVRIEEGGASVPEDLATTVHHILNEDRAEIMEGDQNAGEGVIRLGPTSDPNAFDSMATGGLQKEATELGIHRVEGFP
jgi:uncharacterized protein (TIGR03067 family)